MTRPTEEVNCNTRMENLQNLGTPLAFTTRRMRLGVHQGNLLIPLVRPNQRSFERPFPADELLAGGTAVRLWQSN